MQSKKLTEEEKVERRRQKKNASQKKWRTDNPELSKKKAKDRYHKDPQSAAAKVQKWRKEHPEQWSLIQKACNLRSKYGLSVEEYEKLLLSQNGCCAICGTSDPKSKNAASRRGGFPVDHDHKTGKIRGLLCGHCNTGMGLLGDSIEILKKAIAYLSKHDPSLS